MKIQYFSVLYTSGVFGSIGHDKPTLLKTREEADRIASRVDGAIVLVFDAELVGKEEPTGRPPPEAETYAEKLAKVSLLP